MELKEEIEKVLESLRKAGYDRAAIEKELDYSVNYIDQVLSKGGNRRFLNAIKKLKAQVLQKAIPDSNPISMVGEPPTLYERLLPVGNLKITLQDYIDLLKSIHSKEEEREKELLSIIKELAVGQKAISDTLAPIKEKTEEILINSNTTLDRLSLVETIIRSDDTVIMNNQDRQIGNEVGKSAKEAGSRQLAADKMRKGKGNQAGVNKPHT